MRETVKIVNGYAITRMVGTHGYYRIDLDAHHFVDFRTIKAAAAYAASLAR